MSRTALGFWRAQVPSVAFAFAALLASACVSADTEAAGEVLAAASVDTVAPEARAQAMSAPRRADEWLDAALDQVEAALRASGLVRGLALVTERRPGAPPRALLELATPPLLADRLLFAPSYSSRSGLRWVIEHELGVAGAQAANRVAWTRDGLQWAGSVRAPLAAWGSEALGRGLLQRQRLTGLVIERRELEAGLEWPRHEGQERCALTLEALEARVAPPHEERSGRALLLEWAWQRRARLGRLDFDPVSTRALELALGVTQEPEQIVFSRLSVRASERFELPGAWGSLHTRLETGAILASRRTRLPEAVGFRAGGEGSVRGYGSDRIAVEQAGFATAGRYKVAASAEWRYPFAPRLAGTVFLDAGAVADRVRALKPAVGVGVGLMWHSRLGPLTAYLAWGEREKRLRGGVSIGLRD
ncbi:MAG: BamA/TamA family outer membrane protein [Casimicrobiaceae bacterium]|nr:BamA/TamA family outer membrane protein [Casimicrobiaceae bacterium]MDW8311415.1 BamA/TamA family outer membrane protein [Burkholderiales bacterium]